MFKNLIEYREMQQLRKDHLNQQKRRQAIVLFGALMGLLLVMAAIEAVTAKEPVKPATVAAHVTTTKPQPTDDTSTSTSIQHDQEWSSKQAKYCLNVGQQAGLKEPELTKQYDRCVDHTANWPMEKFE